MPLGPVQILVIGYGADSQFTGAALDELKRLTEHDVVRLVDLLFVHKNEDGSVEKVELADSHELAKLGAVAGALIGFGAAGEEGAEVGALAGAEGALDEGSVFDEAEVWYVATPSPRHVGGGRRHRAPLGDPAARRRHRLGRRGFSRRVAAPAGPARARCRGRAVGARR